MDYANGYSLNVLLGIRNGPISELEAQAIVKELAKGLVNLQERKILHRDININNVVLHFPALEPKPDDLLRPREYFERIKQQRKTILRGTLLD